MYGAMSILTTFLFTASLTTLPPGSGKVIVERACLGCHALKVVTAKRATPQQWSTLVDQMVSRGAEVDDDEIETLVHYLSKNFPPPSKTAQASANHNGAHPLNVNRATAAELASVLGLSAKDADAIIAYREQHGAFKTLAELSKVPGVDTNRIDQNKGRVTF